jgi:hypothetical protein
MVIGEDAHWLLTRADNGDYRARALGGTPRISRRVSSRGRPCRTAPSSSVSWLRCGARSLLLSSVLFLALPRVSVLAIRSRRSSYRRFREQMVRRFMKYRAEASNKALEPTALWRCASMSILTTEFSTGARLRSQSGGSAPSRYVYDTRTRTVSGGACSCDVRSRGSHADCAVSARCPFRALGFPPWSIFVPRIHRILRSRFSPRIATAPAAEKHHIAVCYADLVHDCFALLLICRRWLHRRQTEHRSFSHASAGF